jgi:hypothetical protein
MHPARQLYHRLTPRALAALTIIMVITASCDESSLSGEGQDAPPTDTTTSAATDTGDDTNTEDTSQSIDVIDDDAPTAEADADAPTATDADTSPDLPDIPFVVHPHRLDDTLRLNHLQALGTHNSYHVQPAPDTIPDWAYTHAPLDVQLDAQGVRKLELDLYFTGGRYHVYHVFVFDAVSTCDLFVDCLRIIKGWSDAHPSHHPLLILLEPKQAFTEDQGAAALTALDAEILSVWPIDRLVTPDLIQGDAPTLSDGLTQNGWPTLGSVRGRALFVLHDEEQWRARYLGPDLSTRGRVAFPDAGADLSSPFSAYHTINDPIDAAPLIHEAVTAGRLVRTRADSSPPPDPPDYTRLNAALASGAHFISTDYPATLPTLDPLPTDRYEVSVVGGSPSLCNPLTAPLDGLPSDIEDPTLLPATP